MSPSPRVEGHCGLPEVCRGRGPRASGPCHKVRDLGPNEACQSRARGPGGREHGEDAHFPRTRSVARSVHDRVARRYLVESTSGVHAFASKEDVTGHFGTPMKETGGMSKPLRSLNRPNKKQTKRARFSNDGTTLCLRSLKKIADRRGGSLEHFSSNRFPFAGAAVPCWLPGAAA